MGPPGPRVASCVIDKIKEETGMNRFSTFLLGIVLGALLMFVGLKYTIVRANSGFYLVNKATATLSTAYVDIRDFGASEWREYVALGADITNSDDRQLQEEVAKSLVGNSIDSLWNELQDNTNLLTP